MQTDVVVIGGGPAGLTCATELRRREIDVVVIDRELAGGQIANAGAVEGVPGVTDGAPGTAAADVLLSAAQEAGVQMHFGEATGMCPLDGPNVRWEVHTTGGDAFTSAHLVLATGASHRPLDAPNAERLVGRGLSYCAACDAPLFRGMDVAFLADDPWADDELRTIAGSAANVYLLSPPRPTYPPNEADASAMKNVARLDPGFVSELRGAERLEEIQYQSQGRTRSLAVSGLFVAAGQAPNSALATGSVEMDDQGFVKANGAGLTSAPSCYAVGEVTRGGRSFRDAVSQGVKVAECIARSSGQLA